MDHTKTSFLTMIIFTIYIHVGPVIGYLYPKKEIIFLLSVFSFLVLIMILSFICHIMFSDWLSRTQGQNYPVRDIELFLSRKIISEMFFTFFFGAYTLNTIFMFFFSWSYSPDYIFIFILNLYIFTPIVSFLTFHSGNSFIIFKDKE